MYQVVVAAAAEACHSLGTSGWGKRGNIRGAIGGISFRRFDAVSDGTCRGGMRSMFRAGLLLQSLRIKWDCLGIVNDGMDARVLS